MNNRIDKVNSLLEHEISKIILRDFDFPGVMVTLTHVNATANLIEAKAYISVMSGPAQNHSDIEAGKEKTDEIINILNKNVRDIQRKINKMLNMRPIPRIIFVKDEKISEAARVEALLEKIKRS